MSKVPRQLATFLAVAAAAVAVAPPLAAQDTVRAVRIAVTDPESGDELAVLRPGEEITLIPGEEVTLQTFEPNPDRRHDRRALAATFGFGPTDTPLEIVDSSTERGEATVRLGDANAGERHHVGYKLGDRLELQDDSWQLGRILVRVAAPGDTSVTGVRRSSRPTARLPGSPADAVVDALYNGILLREPDAGAAGARSDIARNGYGAVRRIAANIANSPESRGMWDRGVSSARRLEAIYDQLLGWDRNDVGRDRWQGDLAQVEDGNIAGVVDAIVRSQQFRDRFGI